MNWFSKIHELAGQEYERYLPTAFDGSLTLLEKVNKVIETLNQIVLGVNTVADYVDGHVDTQNEKIKQLRDDFEILKEWLENEGLQERTVWVLNEWFDSGRLAQIINNDVFGMKADKATFEQFVLSITTQLQQKVGGGVKLEPEELSDRAMALVTGNGTVNVLSEPQDYSVTNKKVNPGSDIILKRIGKNLYNFTTDTIGAFVDYRNGNIVPNPDLRASDYIELPPNTSVTISNQSPKTGASGQVGDLYQFVRFDKDKVFLQGYDMGGLQKSETFTTGVEKEFLRITTDNVIKDGMQVELNSTYTTYEPYENAIPSESVLSSSLRKKIGLKTIFTVKKDGTGDFTTIRQATEATLGASENNQYEIQVHEGSYNVLSDYSTVEINTEGFIGAIKHPFVDIIGVGNRNKIILVGTLPYENTTYPASSKQMISTLNLFGEGRLENVTVTADNIRYAVHDDWEYLNMKRHVKNCRFVHYKGGETHFGGKQAWGAGSFSGQTFEFEDCVFESDWDYYAFTSHNNTNFTSPSHHKFVNCDFITTTNLQGLRFESLGSGQIDTVDLLNCRYNGIHLSTITAMTNHIDHYIKGAGNTIAPVTFTAQDDYQYTYDLAGETVKRYNFTGETIPKGTPVRFGSGGQTVMPLGTFDPVFYVGIAMEDITNQSNGLIRIAGYLPISDTGLTLALGDKVGLSNGALTKVTTGDYIGHVQVNGFIKLK